MTISFDASYHSLHLSPLLSASRLSIPKQLRFQLFLLLSLKVIFTFFRPDSLVCAWIALFFPLIISILTLFFLVHFLLNSSSFSVSFFLFSLRGRRVRAHFTFNNDDTLQESSLFSFYTFLLFQFLLVFPKLCSVRPFSKICFAYSNATHLSVLLTKKAGRKDSQKEKKKCSYSQKLRCNLWQEMDAVLLPSRIRITCVLTSTQLTFYCLSPHLN